MKTIMGWICIAIMITSCCTRTPAQQTMTAAGELARINADGSIDMENGMSVSMLAPFAVAANAATTAQPYAGAYLNDCQHLAIFITQGSGQYYILTVIDTAHNAILGADRQLVELGIDATGQTMEEMIAALRARGFERIPPGAAPTLFATIKLAVRFLSTNGARLVTGVKGLGSTLSDVIIVPAVLLTPEMLSPWFDADAPESTALPHD
jgi:hypothetical protein